VALNLARSGLRRVIVERRARSRLQPVIASLPTGERIDIERALSTLPRRQREAIVLRYYLQLDTREVAAALRVNEGTVKSTLFRARATLAEALGIHDTEEANDRGSG
jgi:RNA polymerase sigma-70 factor, ECF subfamily